MTAEQAFPSLAGDKQLLFDGNPRGAEIYRTLRYGLGSAADNEGAAASALLNELGIPGIKYYDGSSRAAGEGTRNLVLFDEADAKILSRNGESLAEQAAGGVQGLSGQNIPEGLRRMASTDRYDVRFSRDVKDEYGDSVRADVVPKMTDDFIEYESMQSRYLDESKSESSFYDPRYSELEKIDESVDLDGGPYETTRQIPRLKKSSGLHDEIPAKPEEGVLYRGVSAEEYADIMGSGSIQSKGEYNLGGQEGLTYYTTDPGSAAAYAHSFAPMQHKSVPGKHSYVIAVRDPGTARHVPGVAEHERGIPGAISRGDIIGVYEGVPYAAGKGFYEVRQGGVSGSSSQPSIAVGWRKVD
jgi:hypothetical protein